jgi:hypothetical protein
MRHVGACGLGLLIAFAFAAPSPAAAQRPPDGVRLTWLSVTNWLLEAGDTRILLDAGFSRVPESAIVDWSRSTGAVTADTALALRIVEAVAPGRRLDWILVGHGHFDNSLDASALARATGARIAGARTICHQAVALGVEAERCLAVEGGEVIEIGPFVRMRVVRWHHSGASSSEVGRLLRAPLELRAPPTPDPATGGLRPGIHEDYPNGGGSRGYLITVQTSWGPVTLLWTNTGNAEAWDVVLDADSTLLGERGVDMSNLEWAMADRPTRTALADALREEALGRVDLWIGAGSLEHVRQVTELLLPRAFIPHHWNDFRAPLLDGVRAPYENPALFEALDAFGIRPIVPTNYFDRFRLTTARVVVLGDGGVRARLGVPER